MVKHDNVTALTVYGHFIYDGHFEKFKIQHPMQMNQILTGVETTGPRDLAIFIDDRNLVKNYKRLRQGVDAALLKLIEHYINTEHRLEIFIRAETPTPTKGVIRTERSRGAYVNLLAAVPGHEIFYKGAGKLGIQGGLVVGGKRLTGITSKLFSPNDDVTTPLDFNNLFQLKSIRAEFVRATGTVFDDVNAEKEIEAVRYIVHSKAGNEWVFDKPYVSCPLDTVNGVIDQIPLSKVTVASVPRANMGPITVLMALPFGLVPEGALFQEMLNGIQL